MQKEHPYLKSDELISIKKDLNKVSDLALLREHEFDLDSINYFELKEYPITWGISKLDEKIGGQPKGKYIMTYGAAGSGKTTLTIQQAIENANLGNKVCYLSLEMPKESFVTQNMRNRAGMKQVGVGEAPTPTARQVQIMKDFISGMKKIDIKSYINAPSFNEFVEIMNTLVLDGFDYILIDNLGMIGRQDSFDEMVLYGKVSAFLKNYVDRTGISVNLIHHTNKGSEHSAGARGFSSFRGNGKIADDADYIVQLERRYIEGGTESNIKIEKDRVFGNNGFIMSLNFEGGKFYGGDW